MRENFVGSHRGVFLMRESVVFLKHESVVGSDSVVFFRYITILGH